MDLPAKRHRRAAVRVAPRVHARGEPRLDAMLDLAEEASRAAPLAEVLAALCRQVARMLGVDVCSIYLRELAAGDRRTCDLVLGATHGFPQAAVGVVRMRLGEGLTGFAVECMRPVSVAMALEDARNKHFAALDDRRFPCFCAVPLVDGGRAIGALVVQRRRPRAFGQREVVLIASMTAPILFALERARLRETQRAESGVDLGPTSHAGAERAHEVTLRGVGVAPGVGLGTTRLVRYARSAPLDPGTPVDIAEEHARVTRALAEAADEVARLEAWALRHAPLERAALTALLSPARFVLDDARLRGRMIAQVEAGVHAEAAIERVMREYTRLLANAGDPALVERAVEVEALCRRARARLSQPPRRRLAPGAILLASRLTVCDAIELGAGHGVGVALAGRAGASPGVPLARALRLPVLADVGDLFRWAADGDRALLNADSGTLILNPSAVDVAAHRARC